MIWESAFVMQFVYCMRFPAIYVKVRKNKSNVRNIVNTVLLSLLQQQGNEYLYAQLMNETMNSI